MADFRYFRCSTWHDDYVLELEPPAKLLFTWCFTNEHISQAGFMTLHPRTAAFETGLTIEEVSALLDRFEADGRILRDGRLIFVVNFPKHQSTSSEKLLKRIARDLEALGQTPLVEEFKNRYPHLILHPSPSPVPSSPHEIKENKEGKGKLECIDTVSRKGDTVSGRPPLDISKLPFKVQEALIKLRCQRDSLVGEISKLREQGDMPGYVDKKENELANVQKEIDTIEGACR